VDYDLGLREHAILERHGYDYAMYEHELEKALRSLPSLEPFWNMYDMTTDDEPLPLIILDQPLCPG